jgi:hypothetical protein
MRSSNSNGRRNDDAAAAAVGHECGPCGRPVQAGEHGWFEYDDGTLSNVPGDRVVRAWHADCMVPHRLR